MQRDDSKTKNNPNEKMEDSFPEGFSSSEEAEKFLEKLNTEN